jgi:hypothetical protein
MAPGSVRIASLWRSMKREVAGEGCCDHGAERTSVPADRPRRRVVDRLRC